MEMKIAILVLISVILYFDVGTTVRSDMVKNVEMIVAIILDLIALWWSIEYFKK